MDRRVSGEALAKGWEERGRGALGLGVVANRGASDVGWTSSFTSVYLGRRGTVGDGE